MKRSMASTSSLKIILTPNPRSFPAQTVYISERVYSFLPPSEESMGTLLRRDGGRAGQERLKKVCGGKCEGEHDHQDCGASHVGS